MNTHFPYNNNKISKEKVDIKNIKNTSKVVVEAPLINPLESLSEKLLIQKLKFNPYKYKHNFNLDLHFDSQQAKGISMIFLLQRF